jgi:endoglucanase
MDSSVLCDYRMVEYMKQTADKHKIKWQPEILTRGGTDTAGIQRWGKKGAISGAISIPTRHIHQVIEMAHKEDISRSVLLLQHCLEDLKGYDWSF